MTRNILPYFFIFFISIDTIQIAAAQVKPGTTRMFTDIYDSAYGIIVYDALNMGIGGDSIRNDGRGYAAQGWFADYYLNGNMVHKGYYIDGQLKAYKNYFPNGRVEREYKMADLNKSSMNVFYEDGKPRSIIIYLGDKVIKEEDYFATGQLEYIEEYDKKGRHYIRRKFYNPDGKPASLLELTDTKKKIYSSKEYYEDGKIKEEGPVVYDEGLGDYRKNGKWKFYNEDGSMKEEKTFAGGE